MLGIGAGYLPAPLSSVNFRYAGICFVLGLPLGLLGGLVARSYSWTWLGLPIILVGVCFLVVGLRRKEISKVR